MASSQAVHDVRSLSWDDVQSSATDLATVIAADGLPEVIVAILRGGAIPAVMIAHLLGRRDVRALTVTHTESDQVNAVKTTQPRVAQPGSLGDVAGRDVLLVDDIAGTGDTLTSARALLRTGGPRRVRAAVLHLNEANWQFSNAGPTYVGERGRGWVVFPWEPPPSLPPAPSGGAVRMTADEQETVR